MDIQASSLSTNRPNLTQISSGAAVTVVEQEQNSGTTSPQAYNRDVFEYSSQQIPSLDVITRRILAAMYDAMQQAQQKAQEQKVEDNEQAKKAEFKKQLAAEQEKDKDKKREAAALQSKEGTSKAAQGTNGALNSSKIETQEPVPVLGAGADSQNLANAQQLVQQVSNSILSAKPAALAQLYNFVSNAAQPPTEAEIIAAANAAGISVADTGSGATTTTSTARA